jgi:hypothetical protein
MEAEMGNPRGALFRLSLSSVASVAAAVVVVVLVTIV